MNLIDFMSSPWAIIPDRLMEIQGIYATHLRGEKIDLAAVEARIGRPLHNEQQDYEVRDCGVAVLPVAGVIANKAGMFTKISGGASAQQLQQQVESLRADPNVRAVVLDIDSPGGNVLGIPGLAESIRALAAEKPTVSVCTGTMASAAYWIGSASNAVYISGLTDYVGSIGVVAQHQYDPRKSDAVKTTELTAGKYKRLGSDNAPLTAEGKAYIQSQIDHIYSVFVDTVAQNRKVSAEQVLAHMADGKIFIGQQAIDAGLVDGVSSVDAMVAKMADNPQQFAGRRKARIAAMGTEQAVAGDAAVPAQVSDAPVLHVESKPTITEVFMDPKELAAKFVAENPEAAAMVRAEGAEAERARIQAVREQSMAGHEALIEKLAFDGKTTGPEAAVQVLAAEKAKVNAAAQARMADAVDPVSTAPNAESAPVASVPGYAAPAGYAVDDKQAKVHAAALAHMKANPGMDYVAAVKVVQANV